MKIPWGHHIVIIGKSKGNRDKALFYVRKTIENGWSRADLQVTIGDRLYEKTGKALTNFSGTLPAPDGYLAKELIKNEYSFALTETVDENNEREVEKALVRNITRTLTELGGGFAYVGHQVRVNVGGEDFWPDLIFYHLKSRRYLVIELKAVNFKPEHIGQLGFYMVAVDRQLKNEWDAPTVGLVLCRDGNRTVVEYALSVTDKPMGVAKYRLTQKTPKELSSMKRAVAKLGTVVDETIAYAERQIAEAAVQNGRGSEEGTTEGYFEALTKRPQLIAANKMDVCVNPEETLKRLNEEFAPQGIEVFPISAVTGEGVSSLLYRVSEILTALPKKRRVFAQEFDPETDMRYADEPYTVSFDETAGEYVLEGPRMEKMLGYTNLESEKGFAFFQKFLRENGMLDELEARGIRDGDTVRIYGFSFIYYK